MELRDLQAQLHEWRTRNFPMADADQQFMGMVEELGEYAHVTLKYKQQIREGLLSSNDNILHQQDALADLVIYLLGVCSYRGWNFQQILEETARDVMKRDWVKYPETGRPA